MRAGFDKCLDFYPELRNKVIFQGAFLAP